MRRNSITIEDIGAGQWRIVNGAGQSQNLPRNEGIVGVAEAFGMRLRHRRVNGAACSKRYTDGTVTCPECGQTSDTFFAQADAYLSSVAEWGRTVADPGYFEGE